MKTKSKISRILVGAHKGHNYIFIHPNEIFQAVNHLITIYNFMCLCHPSWSELLGLP